MEMRMIEIDILVFTLLNALDKVEAIPPLARGGII